MNPELLTDVEVKQEPIELPPLPPYLAIAVLRDPPTGRLSWTISNDIHTTVTEAWKDVATACQTYEVILSTLRVLRIPDKPLTEERVRELAVKWIGEHGWYKDGGVVDGLLDFARALGCLPEEPQ